MGKYIADLKREFQGYTGKKFSKDIIAGITVAAVALPLALAFGIASGAGASAGLVAGIIGGLIAALLSGASYQLSGPTGTMTAILAITVAKHSLQGMFTACFIAGVIILLCGVLKLGRIVNFIPLPVITGFTSGIALIIAFGQIDSFFGTTSAGNGIIQKVISYFENGFHINLTSMLVGLFVIALMIVFPKKWNNVVPASLLGTIIATIAVVLLKLDIPTVGELPKTIILENRFDITSINLNDIGALLSPALSIALLCIIESLFCASCAARMKKETYETNRELISQGVANMALPFFGGIPVSAVMARTTVGIKAGSATRLTGVVHSLVLLFCVLVISPVFKYLPLSALAGVLLVTAYRMNDWESIKTYFKRRMKGPIATFLVTMLATIVFDLTIAILLGIAVALFVFMLNVSSLEISQSKIEKHRLNAKAHDCDIEEKFKDAVVVYITGPMFFLNAQKFTNELEKIQGYNMVILSIRGVPMIDVSGLTALSDYYGNCIAKRIRLIICGTQDSVMYRLKAYGLYDIIGKENFYPSVDKVLTCEDFNLTNR